MKRKPEEYIMEGIPHSRVSSLLNRRLNRIRIIDLK